MPEGLSIRIEIPGQQVSVITGRLTALSRRVEDLRPFWREVISMLWKYEREVFARRGSYDGLQGWANLRKSYWIRKAKKYPGAGILVRTGTLMRSLTGQGEGSIAIVEPKQLIFGTSVPYAIYHQFGYKARDGSFVPARPPLRIGQGLAEQIVNALGQFVWQEVE